MKIDRRSFLWALAAGAVTPARPEAAATDVADYRRRLVVDYDVDVFVAGGGPSGVAAAVSVARYERDNRSDLLSHFVGSSAQASGYGAADC